MKFRWLFFLSFALMLSSCSSKMTNTEKEALPDLGKVNMLINDIWVLEQIGYEQLKFPSGKHSQPRPQIEIHV